MIRGGRTGAPHLLAYEHEARILQAQLEDEKRTTADLRAQLADAEEANSALQAALVESAYRADTAHAEQKEDWHLVDEVLIRAEIELTQALDLVGVPLQPAEGPEAGAMRESTRAALGAVRRGRSIATLAGLLHRTLKRLTAEEQGSSMAAEPASGSPTAWGDGVKRRVSPRAGRSKARSAVLGVPPPAGAAESEHDGAESDDNDNDNDDDDSVLRAARVAFAASVRPVLSDDAEERAAASLSAVGPRTPATGPAAPAIPAPSPAAPAPPPPLLPGPRAALPALSRVRAMSVGDVATSLEPSRSSVRQGDTFAVSDDAAVQFTTERARQNAKLYWLFASQRHSESGSPGGEEGAHDGGDGNGGEEAPSDAQLLEYRDQIDRLLGERQRRSA